jgi:hypothetical protein
VRLAGDAVLVPVERGVGVVQRVLTKKVVTGVPLVTWSRAPTADTMLEQGVQAVQFANACRITTSTFGE